MNPFDLPPRRYSYDEIAQWPDEARRELNDGAPIVLYAPGYCPVLAHSGCVSALLFAFQSWIEARQSGEIALLVDWQIDKWNSVAPDLSYFHGAPKVRADGQCLTAAPDLTIEVLDERTRANDTQRKPALYARQNVALFWLVDPQSQTILVHRNPQPNGYASIERFTRGAVLTNDALHKFQLPLAQIFD